MRSVDHHEARSVGQSRAASASQIVRNATSGSKGRRGNDAYRVREHLTEAEMGKLRAAFKCNRNGHRDWLIKLVIYCHEISQTCDLRWGYIDLPKRTNWCRSVPGPISVPVPGPIRPRDWLAAVAAGFITRASMSTIKNRLPIDFPIDFGTQVTASLCCSLTISCAWAFRMRLRDRRNAPAPRML